MKKLSTKFALLGLLFFGLFLFVGPQQVQAQSASFTDGMYTPPVGNFVTVEEAEERLLAERIDIKNEMKNQTPGTLAYRENVRKLAYFNSIADHLKTGSGVADSIVAGLGAFATAQYGEGMTREKKIALKNLAIEVLTI